MSAFAYSIQQCTEVSCQYNKLKIKNKIIQDGKEEVKLLLFTDKMILYVENLKELKKKDC